MVAEDGSSDGSPEEWARWLRPGRDKMVRSEDVHEIRAYNGAARAVSAAEAGVLCFLQDDDIPDDAGWAAEVVALFEEFRGARLAVLSGLAAEVCQLEFGEAEVDHPKAMKNTKRTRRLPFLTRAGRPFMFATEAWLAPMCVRREAFDALGGFDETLTLPGEPGIGLDIHLSLRAAADHGWTVGVHGATFSRGVGGHGTVSDPAKVAQRLKKREEISARIRQVAGCRWPPEMLRKAADLNAALLQPRPGLADDGARSAIRDQCDAFLARPCPPRRPPQQRNHQRPPHR